LVRLCDPLWRLVERRDLAVADRVELQLAEDRADLRNASPGAPISRSSC
jgi:hypothetical protein